MQEIKVKVVCYYIKPQNLVMKKVSYVVATQPFVLLGVIRTKKEWKKKVTVFGGICICKSN